MGCSPGIGPSMQRSDLCSFTQLLYGFSFFFLDFKVLSEVLDVCAIVFSFYIRVTLNAFQNFCDLGFGFFWLHFLT